MKGISFIDLKHVVCDLLKFGWCIMLNGYVNFLVNTLSLRMTVVPVEALEN